MNNASLEFKGAIAQNYEDLLGPFVFEPFALDLVKRIDFSNAENILELACGSGRVTKHLADQLPPFSSFIASDLNPDMIAIAKSKVVSPKVRWATIDMLNTHYDHDQFDLIVCQFGIMLVADQSQALTEISRILKHGGKLIFSTWADISQNVLWDIGNTVLSSFLSKHPISSTPGPFAMDDIDAVSKLIKNAGFSKCKATSIDKNGEIATAAMAARGFIHGLPVISFIQEQQPALLSEIIQSFENKLIEALGNNPLRISQRAHVFEAIK